MFRRIEERNDPMSRVPAWMFFLFGAIAVVAGVLGVGHAPAGVPKVFWAVVTVAGAASLALGWARSRQSKRESA